MELVLAFAFAENEEDTLNNQVDQDSSTILNECKRDASKRRPSLAQKMTSNLRRLSGATELKIDINDSISANNSKYCNKKIKVDCDRTKARLKPIRAHLLLFRARDEWRLRFVFDGKRSKIEVANEERMSRHYFRIWWNWNWPGEQWPGVH